MSRQSIFAPTLLMAVGCTHFALERSTLNQTKTLSDLRQQVTMDNLAMFANNPSALPFYIVISAGTSEILDQASIADTLMWGGGNPTSNNVNPTAQRQWQENWTLDPVHDPEILEAMRCAFHWVLDLPGAKDENCVKELQKFQVFDRLAAIPPGWFHVGRKHDLPKNVCYASSCQNTYVWVTADGLEGLTQLTLVLIDLATTDTSSLDPPVTVTKTIEYTNGDKKTVKNCTVQTQEIMTKSTAPQISCGDFTNLHMPRAMGIGEAMGASPRPGALGGYRTPKFRIRYQGASDPVLRSLINLRNR